MARTFPRFTCDAVTKALKEKGTYVWNTLKELVDKKKVIDGAQLVIDPTMHEYVWVASEASHE
jgi:hypothetical protein